MFLIQLWSISLAKLKVDVTQHDVILTESELNVVRDRATMAQIMFERYGVPGLYIGNESALSLLSHWLRTGVVVDCGHLVTTIAVIYNGQRCLLSNTILNYGGRNVTMRLLSDLVKSGYNQLNPRNMAHVREVQRIKETLACLSCNYDEVVRFPDRMDPVQFPCQMVKGKVRNAIF